ncbi:MAG: F0F1 ATP synthase subunit B [Ruminococcus sp.]|jgi:F-type H+-transporting ATPase subunit b|nr:F0F1 ATP synthase subunit B [Ruminococcus sp.]
MLDIDIWNFIWAAINLILLFILMKIFLFKPLRKMMDERTRSIQEDIDSAKQSREEAEALKQQYADDISEAKSEAQKILMKAHEDAEAEKAAMLRRSQEEADQIVADANKAIETERKRVLAQAQTQIADLAIEAASKIIGENVDDEKNRRLVDRFLSEEEGIK